MLEMAYKTEYIGTANNGAPMKKWISCLKMQPMRRTMTSVQRFLMRSLQKHRMKPSTQCFCNPLTLYAYNSDLQCPEFVLEGLYSVYDFSWN